MKMRLLHPPVMLAALLISTSTSLCATAPPTPPGALGTSLDGMMVHLSSAGGGISFYSPDFTPPATSWPAPTSYSRPGFSSTRPAYRRCCESTPKPYRDRGYPTHKAYRNRIRGYPTAQPYIPYKNWIRGYTTAQPYIPYKNWIRGYTTAQPYIPYKNWIRGYTTAQPYIPYKNWIRGYTTAQPYIPYKNWIRGYTTAQPYIPYKNWIRGYPTAQPYPTSPPPTTRGVSVCLRVLGVGYTVFTLSPSTTPLTLRVYEGQRYALAYSAYSEHNLVLKPNIRLWSNMKPEIWTRLCVTMDAVKNVAQIFSGPDMSMRRMLRVRYVWSGEPVIDVPGFEGQVTDVQVWDHPLLYKEVFGYMSGGVLGWQRGNVLTWSSISYSTRGPTLLEDVYERQADQPISSRRGKGRRPKGGKKSPDGGGRKNKSVNGGVKEGG